MPAAVRRFLYTAFSVLLALVAAGCGSSGPLVQPDAVPQPSMNGRVVDAASGQPVAGVQVFAGGTTHRTTTGSDGTFALGAVPAGTYEVAAHIPGYATATTTVPHGPETAREVRIQLSTEAAGAGNEESALAADSAGAGSLSPAARERFETMQQRVEQLEARVALISRQVGLLRDEQRGTTLLSMNEDDLDDFKRFFLGRDRDEDECRILNPGVLSFESTDGEEGTVLRARADQPLEVLNRHLGYRLRVVIDEFSVSEADGQYRVAGDALASFEALTPAGEDAAEQWAEARREAYHGSFTHLLRAYGAQRVEDEGFRLYRSAQRQQRSSSSLGSGRYTTTRWVRATNPSEQVVPAGSPSYAQRLRLPERRRVRHGETEWYLVPRGEAARFTMLGRLLDAGALTAEDYWNDRPVCRLVPTDFVPAE